MPPSVGWHGISRADIHTLFICIIDIGFNITELQPAHHGQHTPLHHTSITMYILT